MGEEINIVLSQSTYINYLSCYLKLEILRDMLVKSKPFQWESIIRGAMDIPEKEDE